jgi:hypothetical protein
MAITHEPVCSELSPGAQAHHEVQLAYDFFNRELFDGKLPPCFVSFQRKGSRVRGYFAPDRLGTADGRRTHEIALNPRHFKSRTSMEVMSTLVHEMVHLWQHLFGRKRSRTGYHNKEFAGEMLRLGLHPSHTGEPGGRMGSPRTTSRSWSAPSFARNFPRHSNQSKTGSPPSRARSRAPTAASTPKRCIATTSRCPSESRIS